MAREFKDSGIEWIGQIPKEWKVNKIGNLYRVRNEKVSDKDYPPLSVTMSGIVPQLETAAKTNNGDDRKLVRKGDFAINSRSDRRGSCGVSQFEGSVSLINTILTPRGSMNPQYYNWFFHTELFADEFYKWGHGIVNDLWTTRWQEMKNISIVYPSLPEQQKIADYLDKVCGEVDELVALQEKMIEELKAYKQSVITEAVTKGLNPNVPMKDSGIDWIGEIPEHWNVCRIKNVTSNYKAGPFGSALITGNLLHEGNILVYMPEHVADSSTIKQNPNNLFLQENRREEMSQFFVKTGDIVFPIVGSLGRAIVIKEYMPEGIINQRLSKFSINRGKIDEKFFIWLFGKSEFYAKYIEMNCRGSFIVNLTKSIVEDMPLPVPSLLEQQQIASYLDEKCEEIDSLITLKEQKIEELKEYKKSVIYEYVTGKKEVV